MQTKGRKAIALMSGGLDSTLAAKVIKDQGIDVVGLHLLSPFGCRDDVAKNAHAVGVPLLVKPKGDAYLDLVQNPRYGYGRHMNPCIDCRIFMFQLADVVRQDEGADFIITGEVLGQRPMSQQREAMALIDQKSPADGLIVRPLSAHCFEPTIPEKEGWIDRERLFKISGRGRKEQFALAKSLGITEYTAPAGGCLLTESAFSARLDDFYRHPTHTTPEERLAQSELLRVGRHFRFSEAFKVIIGRNQIENQELLRLGRVSGGTFYRPDGFDGPSAVSYGPLDEETTAQVAALIARYGKSAGAAAPGVCRQAPHEGAETRFAVTRTISEAEISGYRIGTETAQP